MYYSQTPIDNMVESTSTLSQFTLEGKKTRDVIYGKYLHWVNLKFGTSQGVLVFDFSCITLMMCLKITSISYFTI